MINFLFLILLLVSLYLFFNLKNKINNQHRQLILLKKENNTLKNKMLENKITFNNLKIKYSLPKYNNGIITQNCNLYLSPLEISPLLSNINQNTSVKIHEIGEIDNTTWYEISINSQDKINNKGWTKQENVKLIPSIIPITK